ncbi:LINE-1 retrotransposable element ORF1 protein [Plecturocebus cupreus]
MTEKRVKRNEQSLQEIWDYVKRPNLRLIGVPECDEENESKLENTLQDIIQENFPNLARQANIQVQEIQRTPQRYSSRRATPRHIIVRFTRVEMKEKMLRAAREKVQVTHKGKPIRLTADLSAETLQARREWGPTFNILKEKNFQPRISYPAKLSFISEGKIKFFANKQVLRDYITTRPALQELLKEALPSMCTWTETTSISHSKNIPKGKEHHHNEESTSTNGRNSQELRKWRALCPHSEMAGYECCSPMQMTCCIFPPGSSGRTIILLQISCRGPRSHKAIFCAELILSAKSTGTERTGELSSQFPVTISPAPNSTTHRLLNLNPGRIEFLLLSPRLEYSGAILADCNLCLLGSNSLSEGDPRWPHRSSSGLQLPVKVQRVSGRRISRRIFITPRPGDPQAEQPHRSPVRLLRPARLFGPARLFRPARLLCRCPGAVVLRTKSNGLCALLTGEWSYGKAD